MSIYSAQMQKVPRSRKLKSHVMSEIIFLQQSKDLIMTFFMKLYPVKTFSHPLQNSQEPPLLYKCGFTYAVLPFIITGRCVYSILVNNTLTTRKLKSLTNSRKTLV